MLDPAARAQVSALETELAGEFGTRHAVAVSCGTAALHTALAACGIGPGDEVLVAAACVVMTVAAVAHAGARPVFVDSGPTGVGLDMDDLAAKTTERTQAVIPVHLAGPLRRHEQPGPLRRRPRLAADRGRLPGPRQPLSWAAGRDARRRRVLLDEGRQATVARGRRLRAHR
jgi:hypothetical protein